MSMNAFRRLAAKIDQHRQRLATQGVRKGHAIINHMPGYGPDLGRAHQAACWLIAGNFGAAGFVASCR